MPLITAEMRDPREGDHDAEIVAVSWDTSRAGNPMLVVSFKTETQRIVKGYFLISADGAEKLSSLMIACDFHAEARRLKNREIPDFDVNDLIGCTVGILVDSKGFPTDFWPLR